MCRTITQAPGYIHTQSYQLFSFTNSSDDSILVNTFFLKIDYILIFPMCLELLIMFILSSSKLKFFVSLKPFVLLTICFGLVGHFLGDSVGFLILYKCSICMRSLKFSLYIYTVFEEKIRNEVNRQIALIVVTVFILIVFIASLLELFENQYRRNVIHGVLVYCDSLGIEEAEVCLYFSKNELSFHKWLYFVIVTLSTVGYGDIVPTSVVGGIFIFFARFIGPSFCIFTANRSIWSIYFIIFVCLCT